MLKEEQDYNEDIEEQQINEEYKIWKKNTPFLYDTVITHALEWPSLTFEWLPTKDCPSGSDYAMHKVILGTHTSKTEQENLIIANVKLPLEDSLVTQKLYLDNTKDAGGVGLLTKTDNKIEPIIRINHEGEVNKARAMPQLYNVIATKSPNGLVYVFDYTKHPNKSSLGPQLTLQGHNKEGFGLSWSPIRQGWLASGSDDYKVCIWDINAATEQNSTLGALHTYYHSNVVEDVSWSNFIPTMLASVGDDRKIKLWDTRQETPTHDIDAHSHEVNSVDFNKQEQNLLLSGSSDKSVGVWDIRNMRVKLASLEYHNEAVYGVKWAPFSGSLLASFGNDRRVLIWDLSKIGSPQSEEEAKDGPPELLFVHAGHTARISDFGWNLNDRLMMGSVAEDNILQVWQMSHSVFAQEAPKVEEDSMNLE